MWLHANFLHIFFNMIALLIVGPAVEVLLGKLRFLALYLIAGIGGSVCSYLLSQPNVAASGRRGRSWASWAPTSCWRRAATCPWRRSSGCSCSTSPSGSPVASTGGPTSGAWSRASVLAFLYDYAGGLRDRAAGLAITIGGSVAVLGLLALLITGVAPGHVRPQLSGIG